VQNGEPVTELEGEKWQRAYLLKLFAKSGAVKAQLGVFGCSESIGDVFIGIWILLMQVFYHLILRKLQEA
jgi:hypothetical protein